VGCSACHAVCAYAIAAVVSVLVTADFAAAAAAAAAAADDDDDDALQQY
jgi:hypothetical protein